MAAIVLDPRLKVEGLRVREQWTEGQIKHGMDSVRRYYQTHYSIHPMEDKIRPQQQRPTSNNPFAERLRLSRGFGHTPEARTFTWDEELDYYLQAAREPEETLPNAYWRSSIVQNRYPRLSWMAIDLYAIPAMSAEPERTFSKGKVLITDKRTRMAEETAEACLCLSSWLKAGLIELGPPGDSFTGSSAVQSSVGSSHSFVDGGSSSSQGTTRDPSQVTQPTTLPGTLEGGGVRITESDPWSQSCLS